MFVLAVTRQRKSFLYHRVIELTPLTNKLSQHMLLVTWPNFCLISAMQGVLSVMFDIGNSSFKWKRLEEGQLSKSGRSCSKLKVVFESFRKQTKNEDVLTFSRRSLQLYRFNPYKKRKGKRLVLPFSRLMDRWTDGQTNKLKSRRYKVNLHFIMDASSKSVGLCSCEEATHT